MPRGIPSNPEETAAKKAATIERNRTSSNLSPGQAQELSVGGDVRDPNQRRGIRPPMQGGARLDVEDGVMDTENFKYRWYAGESKDGGFSKVDAAIRSWWEHENDSQGNNIKRPSGNESLFLMKLPKEHWLEGKALKAKKIRTRMESSRNIGDGQYAPNGRTSAITET